MRYKEMSEVLFFANLLTSPASCMDILCANPIQCEASKIFQIFFIYSEGPCRYRAIDWCLLFENRPIRQCLKSYGGKTQSPFTQKQRVLEWPRGMHMKYHNCCLDIETTEHKAVWPETMAGG